MSMFFELDVEPRLHVKRGASRRLRHAGFIPAIIYGGQKSPVLIQLPHKIVLQNLEYPAFYSHLLTLNLAGEKEVVILKAIQRHPYKKKILHIDFLRIDPPKKLSITIPLRFLNEEEAIGVVQEGGIVHRHLKEVDIECLATDLPEYIEVNLASLHLNDMLYLSDLQLPKGVELEADITISDQDLPVVSIEPMQVEFIPPETLERGETGAGEQSSARS